MRRVHCCNDRDPLVRGRGSSCALNGCINDAHCMAYLLKSKFGFQDADITLLTDDQGNPSRWPTRANMLCAHSFVTRLEGRVYVVRGSRSSRSSQGSKGWRPHCWLFSGGKHWCCWWPRRTTYTAWPSLAACGQWDAGAAARVEPAPVTGFQSAGAVVQGCLQPCTAVEVGGSGVSCGCWHSPCTLGGWQLLMWHAQPPSDHLL